MNKIFDEICVIGLGFVGLTTALSFANKNYKVLGVDSNEKLVSSLQKNKIPFFEPHLGEKLKKLQKNKKLFINSKLKLDKNKNYLIFICVGTPLKKNSFYDLDNLIKVVKFVEKQVSKKAYIFIKSTILPGTTKKINKIIKNKNIIACNNPEFLREGNAWKDFNYADKIVVGYEKNIFKEITLKIYKRFNGKIILVNSDTGEIIKQLSNSMLSTLISFSNNFALLAEKHSGIDIKSAFDAIKLDKRFCGNPAQISSYLHPGFGFGGYCLPKDISAIAKFSQKYNQSSFFRNVIKVNKDIFKLQLNKILRKIKKNNTIFFLGLSFKEGTDDIRFSQPLKLAKELIKRDHKKIVLCDNLAFNNLKKYFVKENIKVVKKPYYSNKILYILCNKEKIFLNFLKKIPKKQIIDLKYTLN